MSKLYASKSMLSEAQTLGRQSVIRVTVVAFACLARSSVLSLQFSSCKSIVDCIVSVRMFSDPVPRGLPRDD